MSHLILFTGHMIDQKDRIEPRFPSSKETIVKDEIRKRIQKEERKDGVYLGIAAGACGGDILFHELCREISIPTEMYLALPINEFKKKSVSFAGHDWEIRFDKLVDVLPIHIMSNEIEVDKKSNVWAQANLWMLKNAFKSKWTCVTLIALWDGKGGDGDGGTKHMIEIAQKKGAIIHIIDI